MTSSKINCFKHLLLRSTCFLNHMSFLLRCKYTCVIAKFINIKFNFHPTFHVNRSKLTRSKFTIFRAVTQDITQSIFSIELFSLHLHLSNSIQDLSSFEKRNYVYAEFQSTHHKIILGKFSSLLNSNLSAPPIPPFVLNSVGNLSSYPLTNSQHNLSLDFNFSCISKLSIPDLVVPVEDSIK